MEKTKKIKKTTALKALDAQIVLAQTEAADTLEYYGANSDEYKQSMENLKILTEARATLADSCPKKRFIDPNTIVAGLFTLGGTLGSTFMLLVYDEEHVVPKWFKTAVGGVKDFLKSKD